MKQLAVVQIFTWLGLFCMWMFFGLTCSYYIFKAPNSRSELFDRGTEWAGWCFAIYSVVCFLVAFVLPKLAGMTSRKKVHGIALSLGGLSLISVYFIHDPVVLQFTMIGVGIAWASVLSMPYAILAGAIPPSRTGIYMGVFNFFIVIPEMIASVGFKDLVKNVFHNQPVYVVVMGGVSLLIAALMVLRVEDKGDGQGDMPIVGH